MIVSIRRTTRVNFHHFSHRFGCLGLKSTTMPIPFPCLLVVLPLRILRCPHCTQQFRSIWQFSCPPIWRSFCTSNWLRFASDLMVMVIYYPRQGTFALWNDQNMEDIVWSAPPTVCFAHLNLVNLDGAICCMADAITSSPIIACET